MNKHGYGVNRGKNPTYRSWESMKYRCDNQAYAGWADYGGRGIRYCPQWVAFEAFLADMGPRPDGMTLDRIDADGNYEPGNCRWADAKTQRRNRRDVVLYEYMGDLWLLNRLAKEHGVSTHFLYQRIHRDGMSVEEAVNRPSRVRRTQEASNRAQDRSMR